MHTIIFTHFTQAVILTGCTQVDIAIYFKYSTTTFTEVRLAMIMKFVCVFAVMGVFLCIPAAMAHTVLNLCMLHLYQSLTT